MPSLQSAMLKLAAGVISLLGVSSILYGIGFLILRSRFSFLGIWGGAPLSSTEIAEEGGKFLYHHIFIPTSLLIRLLSMVSFKALVGMMIIASLAWYLLQKLLPRRLRRLSGYYAPLASDLMSNFISRHILLLSILSIIVSAAIFEFIWQVVELDNVLRSPTTLFVNLGLQDESSRAFYYYNVLARVMLGILISAFLLRHCWSQAHYAQKALIVLQLLLIITALASLPIAYGKLMLSSSFREVSFSDTLPGEALLLVSQSSNTWVVWNSQKKCTEVRTPSDKGSVIIGSRKDIFK